MRTEQIYVDDGQPGRNESKIHGESQPRLRPISNPFHQRVKAQHGDHLEHVYVVPVNASELDVGVNKCKYQCTNASLLNVEKNAIPIANCAKRNREAAKTEIAPDAIGLFFVLSEDR